MRNGKGTEGKREKLNGWLGLAGGYSGIKQAKGIIYFKNICNFTRNMLDGQSGFR